MGLLNFVAVARVKGHLCNSLVLAAEESRTAVPAHLAACPAPLSTTTNILWKPPRDTLNQLEARKCTHNHDFLADCGLASSLAALSS